MKPRPLQIVGLIAIVVFGGILVVQALRPERETIRYIEGATPLADISTPDVGVPAPALETVPAAPAPDPMTAGSQDARDDLYCSGVIFAVHRSEPESFTPESQARLNSIVALAEAGVGKLIAEGVATSATTGAIANAHGEQAIADHAAGALRLSAEQCAARVAAPAAAPG